MTAYPIDPDEMRLMLTGTEEQRARCIRRALDNAHASGYHLGLSEGAAITREAIYPTITIRDIHPASDPIAVADALVAAKGQPAH